MKHIFLDSHPLSQACNPHNTPEAIGVRAWTKTLLAVGHQVYIPEIIDFEVRRELIRTGKTRSLALLDGLQINRFIYLPCDTGVFLRAANLWAWARNQGMATAGPLKLDIDVILAVEETSFL